MEGAGLSLLDEGNGRAVLGSGGVFGGGSRWSRAPPNLEEGGFVDHICPAKLSEQSGGGWELGDFQGPLNINSGRPVRPALQVTNWYFSSG